MARKKTKLEDELSDDTKHDTTAARNIEGIEIVKELEDSGSKMASTITKLFGRNHQMIKTAVSNKKEKPHKYEVICLQQETVDIPKGTTRADLLKKPIKLVLSDTEDSIRKKIINLFSGYFKPYTAGNPHCKASNKRCYYLHLDLLLGLEKP